MRFSIIIPVYNVEKYIEQCMQSVMEQTFRDYEVIVVDDESPDRSMETVERWARKYPGMVKMIHQKNTRQGGARNTGVAAAEGEYLLFVDSDDYVSTGMLEFADRELKKHPCDILVFGQYPVWDDGRVGPEEFAPELDAGIYDPGQEPRVVSLHVAPWGKAIRREFYRSIDFRFPEKVLYEDVVSRFLYASAKSLVICHEAHYYYRIRENSTMRQKLSPKMLDILKVVDLVLQRFREAGIYEQFRDDLDVSLTFSILCILETINGAEPRSPLQIPLADYLAKTFPDLETNPKASGELKREYRCLRAHRFRWYHLRYLKFNRFREKLLSGIRY